MHRLPLIVWIVLSWIKLSGQSPHGRDFNIDCSQCHTPDNWKVSLTSIAFRHDSTRFQLRGQHQQTDCRACHATLVFSDASPSCTSCHQDMHSQSLGNDCARCHNSNSWVIENVSRMHELVSFPLLGNHAVADCNDCHQSAVPLRFDRIGTACINCHEGDYLNAEKVDHKKAGFSNDCAQCHDIRAINWASSFIHDFFPLKKGHEIEECVKCHTTGYTGTSTKCVDCHMPDFNSAASPNHKTLNLSSDCASCHTTEVGWSPARFPQHDQIYRLEGAHAGIANQCEACHEGKYDGSTPKNCFGCHAADYNNTTDPEHKASDYSKDCQSCHSQTAWEPASFDHNRSKFPLTGAHASVQCQECHDKGYTGTSTKCVDCHTTDFNSAANPDHKTLNLSRACETCHTTMPGWIPASFADHDKYFVITGAHQAIKNDCAACHNGVYNGSTPRNCFGCHAADYNATINPNHKTANYSTNCESCHHQTAWQPATFDHNKTRFPLTGAHTAVNCQECHISGYSGTSGKCVDCHLADFNAAASPNHKALALSSACESCHSTVPGWAPASFTNHSKYYVITGAHTAIANDCAACHHGVYNGLTPKTCFGCHAADYNATSNPNHKTSNFPTNCESCHSQNAWIPASFDHNKTRFALTGAHITVDCNDCHSNGYTGTPSKCLDCHIADYNASTNPKHKALNLSTDCISCHTTAAGWSPASFPAHNQYYVLSGAHANIASNCAACHNGNYTGTTPNTCFGCHSADFNSAKNPNHQTAKFPTTCETCHSQSAWTPSTFNHDGQYFRIYSGTHKGEWSQCAECHTTAGNFSNFSCTNCHEHNNKANVDKEHKGVSGYSYTPTSCYSCHRNE